MAEITVETIFEQIGQLSASDRAKLYKMLASEAIKPANGTKASQKNSKPSDCIRQDGS